MKVVIDANVYLAGFATRGLSSGVLEICIQNHDLFICEDLLEEVRKNLVKKFKVPEAKADDLVVFLRGTAACMVPKKLPPDSCRDPDDVFLLGLAEAAEADCIITGDKDLLDMKQWDQTRILNPRAFYDLIREEGG